MGRGMDPGMVHIVCCRDGKGGHYGLSGARCGDDKVAGPTMLALYCELLQHVLLIVLGIEVEKGRCGGNLVTRFTLESA